MGNQRKDNEMQSGDYLYTIECCGNAIDIHFGVQTRCNTCNDTFIAGPQRALRNVPPMKNANDLLCCGQWYSYPTPGNDTGCSKCGLVFNYEKLLMPLDKIVKEPIAVVLGQDDWAFYARTISGRLVYWVSEMSGQWLDAPHRGMHDCLCPEPNKAFCRIDSSWMMLWVVNHKNEIEWQNSEGFTIDTREMLGWPSAKDSEFIINSRRNYLAD